MRVSNYFIYYMLFLHPHTDFKAETNAFATTKLLLDIWPNISNISVL
jgi:hypothetical protein